MPHITLQNVSVEGFNAYKKVSLKKAMINALGRKKDPAVNPHRVSILKNINFSAVKGDRIGILGPNGCGKSSLLRTICGTYPPHSGTVETSGVIVSMLGSGIEFDASLDAVDNIRISLIYTNRLAEYNEKLVDEILQFAELEDQRDVPLYQYSSGMLARLAFSVNIFQKGDILITDEIFATGDARFINKSRQKMKDLWDSVDIAINVSHDVNDIRELCTTCYVMQKGEIVHFGPTAEAIEFYDRIYTNNADAHR